MQDKKLREAFRSLVQHLNLSVTDYWGYGYDTNNCPTGASCNIARLSDIRDIQDQIDKLKKAKRMVKKRR